MSSGSESCRVFGTVLAPIANGSAERLSVHNETTLAPFDHQGDSGDLDPRVKEVLLRAFPQLLQGTLDSFESANRTALRLKEHCLPERAVLQDVASQRHGIRVELSNVGFSTKGEQALVYVGIWAGQGSRGWYVLLQKDDNDQWVEVARLQAWIA
jgi:hypothetical protein